MNKKEVTKRLIRAQTCDTCRWQNKQKKKCFFTDDPKPDTDNIKYRNIPEENTCENWDSWEIDGTWSNASYSAQGFQDAMDALQKSVVENMSIPKELLGSKDSHIRGLLKILGGFLPK